MMTHLIKIGNYQGIKIPKPFIEQAHLQGKKLKLHVVKGGLFITPMLKPRENWAKLIEATLVAKGIEEIDQEWLDSKLTSDDKLDGSL